jgi:hypothetical protein
MILEWQNDVQERRRQGQDEGEYKLAAASTLRPVASTVAGTRNDINSSDGDEDITHSNPHRQLARRFIAFP